MPALKTNQGALDLNYENNENPMILNNHIISYYHHDIEYVILEFKIVNR